MATLRLILLCCVLCLTVLAQPRAAAGHRRLALLVGINRYKHVSELQKLRGCVNDVLRFRDLLTSKFGFAKDDVQVLTDAKATRSAILAAFRSHLIGKATTGDTVVFYYAGHGSRAINENEPSGYDETIVPHDSRDPQAKVFDITDKELRGLFGDLRQKTSEITAILDSCHSGTAIRGNRQRSIPADTRARPSRALTRGGTAPIGVDRGIVFLAASRADQNAYEHFAQGADHGVMSYFLARELSRVDSAMTWRDVMDRVGGMVTARYPLQEPQIEGAAANKLVFGDGSYITQQYFPVSKSGNGTATVNAGVIHGVTAGSTFDVFPPGTRQFDKGATPIARLEVTQVGAFTSEAKVVTGGPVRIGARAVERTHNFADFRLRVYLDPALPTAAAEKLKLALAASRQIQMAQEQGDCDLQIASAGTALATLAADGSPLSPPVPLNDPGLAETIERQVTEWARWFHLLLIDNPSASQFVIIKADPVAFRPDGRVLSGDELRITVRNNSSVPFFVSALDISGDGSIAMINLAVEGAAVSLAPGKEIQTTIEMFVPEGRNSVRDVIKVFAATTAVDFRMLTSAAIRAAATQEFSRNPLSALLANAAFGMTRSPAPVALDDWATASKPVLIEKK